MTRWLLFSPLPWPCQLQWAPTSPYDSLVAFSTSPSTMLTTTSTNESLWLVGAFFHLSLDHAGYKWHQWVIMARWCLFHFSLNYAGYNRHQRVITTRWCLFSLLSRPHQPQRAPTSLYGSLVPFFRFSLDYAGYNRHQRVIMTHWCLFSLLSRPRRPQRAPMSHKGSLVAFFTSTLTITTISLVVVFYIVVVIILLYIWNINLLSTRSEFFTLNNVWTWAEPDPAGWLHLTHQEKSKWIILHH